jgi:chromosome condensin MukBEF MukE localization factor
MKRLVTVSNGPEAELIVARLREAGIGAVARGGALAAALMELGTHEVYVEDDDLDRARAVIRSGEGMSEGELVQAEEEDAAARDRDELQHEGTTEEGAEAGETHSEDGGP